MQPIVQPMPEQTKIATLKIVLWVGMASIFMIFAGLTSGLMVRLSEGNWNDFKVPSAFYYSTGIIIASSLTMFFAQRSAKHDRLSELKIWMIVTLSLGLAFIFSQFFGYSQLISNKIFLSGGNVSGSFFYAITGLHAAHVIGGILALIITSGKSILEKYNSKNNLGIELCATYWHYMGFIWLSLLVFICIFGGYH